LAAREHVTVPAKDRVRPYQQPQAVQGGSGELVEQRGQPCPVGGVEPDPLPAELALQDCELVA
jgi:hypothetical protein